MSVTWPPDCELARVHFFEAVEKSATRCRYLLTQLQDSVSRREDMSVTWPPDCELARVHFFEKVDIITDEEFDLLERMRQQPAVDVGGFLDMLDSLALCDASDDECAKEDQEEEKEDDADSGDGV